MTVAADLNRRQSHGQCAPTAPNVFRYVGEEPPEHCSRATLGLPLDLEEALTVALAGAQRLLDVVVVNERPFVVMAGLGFDAEMVAGAGKGLKRRAGWAAYAVCALRHLWDRPTRVVLRADGGPPLRRWASAVIVANLGTLQGNVALLPDAAPDDGVLDVAVLPAWGLIGWPGLAADVLLRRKSAQLTRLTCRDLVVDARRARPWEADGDAIGLTRQLRFSVQAQSLLVRVPAGPAPHGQHGPGCLPRVRRGVPGRPHPGGISGTRGLPAPRGVRQPAGQAGDGDGRHGKSEQSASIRSLAASHGLSRRSGRARAWLPGRAWPAGVRALRWVVLAVRARAFSSPWPATRSSTSPCPRSAGSSARRPAACGGPSAATPSHSRRCRWWCKGPHRSRPLAARQVLTGSDQCGSAMHRSPPPHQVTGVSSSRSCCRRPGGCRA